MTDKAAQVIEWCIQPDVLPAAVKVQKTVRRAAKLLVLLVPALIISTCIHSDELLYVLLQSLALSWIKHPVVPVESGTLPAYRAVPVRSGTLPAN
jgi:hypothetical protein